MNDENKDAQNNGVPPRIPIKPQSAASRPQPPAGSSPPQSRVVLRPSVGSPGANAEDTASSSQTSVLVLTPEDGAKDTATSDPAPATTPTSAKTPETPSEPPNKHDSSTVLGSSSQTIHIELPEDDSAVTARPGSSGPATVRLKRPPTVQVKRFSTGLAEAKAKEEGTPVPAKPTPPATPATDDLKRTTSRIPLEAAQAATTDTPITVRVRPRAPLTVPASVPRPGSNPLPDGPKPPSAAQTEAAKRKTSRISLESALEGSETPASPGAPKTIRLKRPSEAATVRVRPQVPVSGEVPSARQTAQLPTEDLPDAEGPITRRKTIKVKRPTRSSGLSEGYSGEETETSGTASAMNDLPMLPVVPVRENPIFPICAIAALLVGIVLVWVLASQAFGRNASLTPLSSWPSGPTLWMPGRILTTR